MGRLLLAWQILTNRPLAEKLLKIVQNLHLPSGERLPDQGDSQPANASVRSAPAEPPSGLASAAGGQPAVRSDAVTLLSALQREGRLIDFLKEPIESYTDAQVGAAVRDIHRDCSLVLERQLGIRPVLEQEEGSIIEFSAQPDPGRIRLSGAGAGAGAASGRLVHHGWQVTRCELSRWTGTSAAADVIAAAEVEVPGRGSPRP